ncbi:hypothetical protein CXB51_024156 [Gossypium anomalum]|uniref:Integrase catalytic domain-containing protein n=1 Tax=Gossypium anomalum TaxID=47600 RepID=A0A8J6CPL2_9ROSI|nr:hypothetical protein CXB51_024156 [Gossypium anomalum]
MATKAISGNNDENRQSFIMTALGDGSSPDPGLGLLRYGLHNFVLGTIVVPPQPVVDNNGVVVPNPEFLFHVQQDKLLASWLLSTVNDDVLVHLNGAKTSFKKKGPLTGKEYLAKVQSLCETLMAAGTLITEQEHVNIAQQNVSTTSNTGSSAKDFGTSDKGRGRSFRSRGRADAGSLSSVSRSLSLPPSKGYVPRMARSGTLTQDIKTGIILLKGRMHNGLYQFDLCNSNRFKNGNFSATVCAARLKSSVDNGCVFDLWYKRLGHPCNKTVMAILHKNNVAFNTYKMSSICFACQLGKSYKLPFSPSTTTYSAPFELIVPDLWGPTSISSECHSYYVSFFDAYSHHTWLYLIKNKSEALKKFFQLQKLIAVQFGCSIKVLQSDWGGKFWSFPKVLAQLGIHNRLSCPHTSEQNGLVERKHRHIVDVGLTLLAQANVPLRFWAHAFISAVYLINRFPTPILHGKSLYEVLHKIDLPYIHVWVFGYRCYPYLRSFNTHKLEYCSRPCVFLGYSLVHKGYKCMMALGPLISNLCQLLLCYLTIRLAVIGFLILLRYQSKSGIFKPRVFSADIGVPELATTEETLSSKEWALAAQQEFDALIRNQTWDLVPLPTNKRAVGCKWVFKLKRHADGTIARYKGRLVVKGYLQEAGIDFYETFSLVVKPTTIRVVLTLTVKFGWHLKKLDVDNAFLNGDLFEEIYMVQPLGFEQKHSDQTLVCKLKKALYGLFLSQQKYVLDLLQRAKMDHAKGLPTPMVTSCTLSRHVGSVVENASDYRSIVGALQYVVITRPDILFAINKFVSLCISL